MQLYPKTFSRSGWTYKSVSLNSADLERIDRFAHSTVGDKFNARGYFMPCGLGTKSLDSTMSDPCNSAGVARTWYCSELVTHALAATKNAELLENLGVGNDQCLHPHALYKAINNSEYTTSTAPVFKVEMMQYA